MILIFNDKWYGRSTAALKALALLGKYRMIAKILLLVPAFIRDMIYDLVARHRHRLKRPI